MKWLRKEWDVDQETIELIITADKQAQQKWFNELESQGFDFLVLDRYLASQLTYSIANGMDPHWVVQLQKKMRPPDIEIYLDIEPEESMKRKGKYGENDRYESDLQLLTRVRELYLDMPYKRLSYSCPFVIVDARSASVGKVHQNIIDILRFFEFL